MDSYESGHKEVLLLSAGFFDELGQTHIVETHDVADAVGLVQSTRCVGNCTQSGLMPDSHITAPYQS
jgi:hypothetical protein